MFSYQLLNPKKRLISSLISEERGAFKYRHSYPLESKRDGVYACGSILVEWFHATDRYVVQAQNLGTDETGRYSKTWADCKQLGHKIDAQVSMLLMFEIRTDKNIYNCRIRHVPTKILFFDWNNSRIPRFTVIREGHDEELESFFGSKLQLDGRDGGSSYEGTLLSRFERHPAYLKKKT